MNALKWQMPILRWLLEVQKSACCSFLGLSLLLSTTVLIVTLVIKEPNKMSHMKDYAHIYTYMYDSV